MSPRNIIIFLIFIINPLLTSQGKNSIIKQEGRIIGGIETDIVKIPYLILILYKGIPLCGGALITTSKVLTAAHCIHNRRASNIQVIGGTSFLNQGGIKRKVLHIQKSYNYNPTTYQNDYAILKLTTPMEEGENIKTIELCTKPVTAGTQALVAGWGRTENNSLSNRVRSIEVPIISKDECYKHYNTSRLNIDKNVMICASEPGLKDSCSGDSGGPLVVDDEVCGIVSWGIGCARPDKPGVYTDVYNLYNMINYAISIV